MTNNEQLGDDLNAFASELRRQSLNADVPNRDQLMFECGKASAGQQLEPVRPTRSRNWVQQTMLVACSICLGAFLMYQVSDTPSVQSIDTTANTVTDSEPPNALAAKLEQFYSADQIAAVRSNQLLCASSNSDVVTNLVTVPVTTPSFDQAPTLRARMFNSLMP